MPVIYNYKLLYNYQEVCTNCNQRLGGHNTKCLNEKIYIYCAVVSGTHFFEYNRLLPKEKRIGEVLKCKV